MYLSQQRSSSSWGIPRPTQLSHHLDGPVQRPYYCWRCTYPDRFILDSKLLQCMLEVVVRTTSSAKSSEAILRSGHSPHPAPWDPFYEDHKQNQWQVVLRVSLIHTSTRYGWDLPFWTLLGCLVWYTSLVLHGGRGQCLRNGWPGWWSTFLKKGTGGCSTGGCSTSLGKLCQGAGKEAPTDCWTSGGGAIQSLYNRSESCVCILDTKSWKHVFSECWTHSVCNLQSFFNPQGAGGGEECPVWEPLWNFKSSSMLVDNKTLAETN